MKSFVLATLGATALGPAAALAGGMTTPVTEPAVAPPVAVVAQVTPDWTGFYAGGQLGWGSVSTTKGIADGDGMLGGVMGGYRYDFGTFIAGIEGDYSWSNIDLGTKASGGSLDDIYRLKLQAGADLGQTYLYGTAGWAWAQGNINGRNDTVDGWVAGIGADYDLGNNWTLGGEVLYNGFNNIAKSGYDADATTVMLRAAYRF